MQRGSLHHQDAPAGDVRQGGTMPLVVSAFIRLPAGKAKHPYVWNYTAWRRAVEVRADYELWCGSPADCMIIRGWRETLKLRTKVIATSLKQLEHLIASRTNVSIGDVRRATNGSVWDGIQGHGCPSAEVLKVWLAKPFLVEASMALHPEHHPICLGRCWFQHLSDGSQKTPRRPVAHLFPGRRPPRGSQASRGVPQLFARDGPARMRTRNLHVWLA